MGVNVVTYGGKTIVDMTNATITPETVLEGYVGYGADGEPIVGTATTTKHFTRVITIPVSAWVDNEQTVAVNGVLANKEKCTVIIGPDWDSGAECTECGVDCIAQGDGTLTFQCTHVPGEDVTMNAAVFIV